MTRSWVEPIGANINRVEALAKVTGRAVYTADVPAQGAAHAVQVPSQISAGRVRRIDTREAERATGVLAVLTHQNVPRWRGQPAIPYYAESRLPLSDDRIHFGNQCLALVIADTLHQAEYAASLVLVDYQLGQPVPNLDAARADAYPPTGPYPDRFPTEHRRGDAVAALRSAPVRVDREYRTATISHAPMEPSSTLASWDGDQLTLHDSSQGVFAHREAVATAFGLPVESVRLISSLIGGGFGNKSYTWGHTLLAALAARVVRRPVRLTLNRKEVFTGTGHMPAMIQRVRLGARRDGTLTAITHDTVNATSPTDDRNEPAIQSTPALYAVPNLAARAQVAKVNIGTSGAMRTPGDTPGQFAVECAMDELAYELGMDPLELRRKNYAERHPQSGKPFSGKRLLRCYEVGAAEFGWSWGEAEPGTLRDGNDLVGYGMASGIRAEHSAPAAARVEISSDGTAEVRTGTQEIGGGTLTTMVQVAASGLGVSPDRVSIKAGDTDLPQGAPTFGSMTSGSTGSAVHLGARRVRVAAIRLAIRDTQSPLHGAEEDAVDVRDGRLLLRADPSRGETYVDLLDRHGIGALRRVGEYQPEEESAVERATFGAHFVEVRIDRQLSRVRVARHVGVFDCGRVLNEKTATNQARGGMIFAMGGALMEQLVPDPVSGRLITPALTDYHVPVHADIGDVRALFVGEHEPEAHPVGAKGLGEICSIGIAPAIANAVFHATGKRVRELPITPEKLL
ncbi:xanthine dehydrogenase molybdenum binding subunit apoprotein [Tamaricihabitans halophyticus]|uniref:Xanthine dehydrogenase molybdenum binding subunit apoprotein n=1 Tax=Tamaricihabitans halophyticus TaxID=1262583 RepID=A0A4R2QQB2_9PSEU|nr:xanthine dehydrogenase family protein molybdopterin-binding subunit [Tamaricihabitans halophyticus]TCP51922.1 xanthine dehydrogenase molybdenum binding subunit apoprotein [Tamaricihabitans halophyticus]